jgi:broad specificity phosphatase PhoE
MALISRGLPVAFVLTIWALPAQAQAGTILLVRHAEKSAPSGDPGLTAAGEQRARDLARTVADADLAAIITTQYRRTQLTGAPAARAASLEPLVIQASGNMATDAGAVVQALDALPPGSTALVVGHSNTLGPIIAALGGPRIPDLCDAEHSTLFLVQRPVGGKVGMIKARYGAAEPAEAGQC